MSSIVGPHIKWEDAIKDEVAFKKVFTEKWSVPILKTCFKVFAKIIDWDAVIRNTEILDFYIAMYSNISWVVVQLILSERRKLEWKTKHGNKRYVDLNPINPYDMFKITAQTTEFEHITQDMLPFGHAEASRNARPVPGNAKAQARATYLKSVKSFKTRPVASPVDSGKPSNKNQAPVNDSSDFEASLFDPTPARQETEPKETPVEKPVLRERRGWVDPGSLSFTDNISTPEDSFSDNAIIPLDPALEDSAGPQQTAQPQVDVQSAENDISTGNLAIAA